MQKSNLTDILQENAEISQKKVSGDNRSRLARLVDAQLEKRGTCTAKFTDEEKRQSMERELLGPKFYKQILEECGIDFWNVFKYASCFLYDEHGAHLYAKHPVGVERLFEILTGEKEFVKAAQIFFMEVFPTYAKEFAGIKKVFCCCCFEAKNWHSLNDLKTYFALELTDEKIDKLEVLMEDANAEKEQRFKANDQFAERQPDNMEKIHRLLDSMGADAREMVIPLIFNELRVNPRDIFRYYFHQDMCVSMVWGGGPGAAQGGINIPGRLPAHSSDHVVECMRILGVTSTGEKGYAKHYNIFWSELQNALQTSLVEKNASQYEFPFYELEGGYRGWGIGDGFDIRTSAHYRFLQGYVREDSRFLISSYGAEATKDRLDAIFTPEVMEVLLEDYGFLTMSEREVENRLKKLRKKMQSEETPKEAPKKKGFFGLFRKG